MATTDAIQRIDNPTLMVANFAVDQPFRVPIHTNKELMIAPRRTAMAG